MPKFGESISSDDAFRYLGTSDAKNLSDDDRLIVRAFKFLSFCARFTKLTYLLPEEVRLQHLYCCLVGQAQDRAVIDEASSSEELLDHLASWYASSTDPRALEDVLRQKLELSSPFPNESLSDYISRFSQYYRFAKEVSSEFPVSESTCCRMFLHSLRKRSRLFGAMVYASGRKVTKLDEIFKLARDCEGNLNVIHAADNLLEDSAKPNRFSTDSRYNNNFSNRSSNQAADSARKENTSQGPKPTVNRSAVAALTSEVPVYNYFEDQPIQTQCVSRMTLSPFEIDVPSSEEDRNSEQDAAQPPAEVGVEPVKLDSPLLTPDEISTNRSLRSAVLSVGITTATVPITIDDGADFSVMGCNLIGDFQEFAIPLDPITFRVANDDEATCSSSIFFDVSLPTEAGNVTLRRHRIYIADITMSEVLLGRPFLQRLGIDVESLICIVARSASDDESVNSECFVDHVSEDAPSLDTNSFTDLQAALDERLQDCATNDAPVWFLSELRALLFEFIDIFRISL